MKLQPAIVALVVDRRERGYPRNRPTSHRRPPSPSPDRRERGRDWIVLLLAARVSRLATRVSPLASRRLRRPRRLAARVPPSLPRRCRRIEEKGGKIAPRRRPCLVVVRSSPSPLPSSPRRPRPAVASLSASCRRRRRLLLAAIASLQDRRQAVIGEERRESGGWREKREGVEKRRERLRTTPSDRTDKKHAYVYYSLIPLLFITHHRKRATRCLTERDQTNGLTPLVAPKVSLSSSPMSVQLLFLLGFLYLRLPTSSGESPTCLTVYREGGAPAVFQSPKCPRWTLLADGDPRRPRPNCDASVHQGRRRSQEDRIVCALGMRIPFLGTTRSIELVKGRTGSKEIDVGLLAVFDGHNGAEASDMASRLLLDYFLLHLYFVLDGIYSMALKLSTNKLAVLEHEKEFQIVNTDKANNWNYADSGRWILPTIFDGPFHKEVLKEALLRSIHDIDTTFSKEAFQNKFQSGSTVIVLLIADGQVLAANVGDSKALLCSESFMAHDRKEYYSSFSRRRRNKDFVSPNNVYTKFNLANFNGVRYHVKELTVDHHPDREDERIRVEAAGGHIMEWAGVPRVNGELAISRAIGDVAFKSYGIISTPEMTDWIYITSNDSYLIAASDGLLEKMTTQEVCDILWYEKLKANMDSESIGNPTYSLSDVLVDTAFEMGTFDNMAAIVVPLHSTSILQTSKDEFDLGLASTSSLIEAQEELYRKSAGNDAVSTSLLPMDYSNQIALKFKQLLVETEHKKLGCFYLSENLNENTNNFLHLPDEDGKVEVHDVFHALVETNPFNSGWTLEPFKDHNLCWYFGIHNGEKSQCLGADVFLNFLGLLDSIPYSNSSSTSESFGYSIPRYILNKRFDHGSFGEVWLAFHWNCSQGGDGCIRTHKKTSHFDPFECVKDTHINASDEHCSAHQSDEYLFILKRIMVERGTNAYLSGLREKHFGELFLNASMTLKGLTTTELGTTCMKEVPFDLSDLFEKNVNIDQTISYVGKSKMASTNYEEGLKHIARFVESFESESKEIWLVFRNEGISLSKLLYSIEETNVVSSDARDEKVRNVQVLHPSAWWHWLRTTERGQKEMKSLIWQLLMALKVCHDHNITHRDIKPGNMIICLEEVDSGRCLQKIPVGESQERLKMRIIDFGSAIDDFTMKHLYGSGPTRSEQTVEYAPPEALLNASWFQAPKSKTLKYDMWSVGVVMLELIFGSPHVFEITDRTRVLLDQHLEGWSEHTKELAYKLRSYMELCILVPGISPQHDSSGSIKHQGRDWLASWKCSEESFAIYVKNRDPLKLGFQDIWALRLVRQLLVWHPEDRLTVDEALSHPYFKSHYQTSHTQD